MVLTALFAGGWNLPEAWSDRAAWDRAPASVLSGIENGPAEPAEVRALWNKEWIFFEFRCVDRSIVSPGDKDGMDHFKIGDVVEIFLAQSGAKNYAEVHATPTGKKSAYFFQNYRKLGARPAGGDQIAVRAARTSDGWRAVLCLPWSMLDGPHGEWEILAGRYDYAAGLAKAELSSFPPQTAKPDFHLRSRYARLELRP
jgi:hypothetical protein